MPNQFSYSQACCQTVGLPAVTKSSWLQETETTEASAAETGNGATASQKDGGAAADLHTTLAHSRH